MKNTMNTSEYVVSRIPVRSRIENSAKKITFEKTKNQVCEKAFSPEKLNYDNALSARKYNENDSSADKKSLKDEISRKSTFLHENLLTDAAKPLELVNLFDSCKDISNLLSNIETRDSFSPLSYEKESSCLLDDLELKSILLNQDPNRIIEDKDIYKKACCSKKAGKKARDLIPNENGEETLVILRENDNIQNDLKADYMVINRKSLSSFEHLDSGFGNNCKRYSMPSMISKDYSKFDNILFHSKSACKQLASQQGSTKSNHYQKLLASYRKHKNGFQETHKHIKNGKYSRVTRPKGPRDMT